MEQRSAGEVSAGEASALLAHSVGSDEVVILWPRSRCGMLPIAHARLDEQARPIAGVAVYHAMNR